MIRAILFDLYETLVTENGLDVPRAARLGKTLGLDAAAFRDEWHRERPRIVRGRLSFREALLEIGGRLNAFVDPGVVDRVCDERRQAKREVFERIDRDILTLVAEVHQRGIRLAAVSNCFAEDVDSWDACELAPYFAHTAFSFALGAAKPEREIYLQTARSLDVDPSECLYVGDGQDDELEGAERSGMRAARATWFVTTSGHQNRPTIPAVSDRGGILALIAGG